MSSSKTLDANLIIRMFNRESIVHSRKRWEEVGGAEQHKLHPIGTGPYQLVDWKVGVGTEWVKHPQYWRGEPMAERVNVKVITENRARLAALQTGEVQVAWLQAEQVSEAQKDPQHQGLVRLPASAGMAGPGRMACHRWMTSACAVPWSKPSTAMPSTRPST